MTLIGEKLTEAISKREVDLNSFIWKGNKTVDKDGKYRQTEKKLMSMNADELKNCYEHCKIMLFNTDNHNPGRHLVLKNIDDQRNSCGAELFIRFLEQEHNMARFSLMESINTFLKNNKEFLGNTLPSMDLVFSNIPREFENIPLNLIIDGCLDRLGVFNKKHITRSFILKQGIWLTPAESKELTEYDQNGKMLDRLDLIRFRLSIKDIEYLGINPRGINYTQMRALLNIKPNKKYSDLTTVQLDTLRNRLLFSLERTVSGHIVAWEKRMEEIELVAEHKGFKL